jgi:hypothetical protein
VCYVYNSHTRNAHKYNFFVSHIKAHKIVHNVSISPYLTLYVHDIHTILQTCVTFRIIHFPMKYSYKHPNHNITVHSPLSVHLQRFSSLSMVFVCTAIATSRPTCEPIFRLQVVFPCSSSQVKY